MPEVGALYELAEQDYKFGTGGVLVRVTKIVNESIFDNESWWDVEAMVEAPHHGTSPGQERKLYVRAVALATSRRDAPHGGPTAE